MAVFIDAREPGNPQNNRREKEFLEQPLQHATFIADELVPVIDNTYRTDPRPEARLIAGVSYGGLSAAYIAASRSDVFHNLASFSPSFWVLSNVPYLPNQAQKDGAILMQAATNTATECGGDTGFTCPRLPLKIFMTSGLPDWDIGDLSSTINTLKKLGYTAEYHQVREGHTWDNWRGLSDEMLVYFFGGD
jgi:enterochelin esterase-like enzyme